MATGREMYSALKQATSGLPAGSNFTINLFDMLDLCKLTAKDLELEGYSPAVARRISDDLVSQSLQVLGDSMGIKLVADKASLELIPGEGFRGAAELLQDDPQTLEEMLAELHEIRHGRD